MTRSRPAVRILLALLFFSLTAAFGVAMAASSPAISRGDVARVADHVVADVPTLGIHKDCDEDVGGTGSAEPCCMPAFGTHHCGFGAAHPTDGPAIPAIHARSQKWNFPSEQAAAGLHPKGELPPPKHFG